MSPQSEPFQGRRSFTIAPAAAQAMQGDDAPVWALQLFSEFQSMRGDMQSMRGDIQSLRNDFKSMEDNIGGRLHSLSSEMSSELKATRNGVTADTRSLKNDLEAMINDVEAGFTADMQSLKSDLKTNATGAIGSLKDGIANDHQSFKTEVKHEFQLVKTAFTGGIESLKTALKCELQAMRIYAARDRESQTQRAQALETRLTASIDAKSTEYTELINDRFAAMSMEMKTSLDAAMMKATKESHATDPAKVGSPFGERPEATSSQLLEQAESKNRIMKRWNFTSVASPSGHRQFRALRPVYKTNAGLGPPLPGFEPVDSLPELRVGDMVPREFFPATFEELMKWTPHRINALSMLLNETFGIKAGDNVRVLRCLLLSAITK